MGIVMFNVRFLLMKLKGKPTGELKEVNGKTVKVITRSLTLEESRREFPYRPFSKFAESRFGGNSLLPDETLLSIRGAKRCNLCHAPTKKSYLTFGVCPDCSGIAEIEGKDPRSPTPPQK